MNKEKFLYWAYIVLYLGIAFLLAIPAAIIGISLAIGRYIVSVVFDTVGLLVGIGVHTAELFVKSYQLGMHRVRLVLLKRQMHQFIAEMQTRLDEYEKRARTAQG